VLFTDVAKKADTSRISRLPHRCIRPIFSGSDGFSFAAFCLLLSYIELEMAGPTSTSVP
jgi:hypothetical protein